MELAELDEALDDLETRLERLRALYEQYFLGIEKVPPVVARTDVDRRIWALRKLQIRNTAKRYKLQTLVQRYSTFQQYWARICREIENGTYSPHVARARRQLDPSNALTIATRRRLGMYRQSSAPPEQDPRERALQEAQSELAAALDETEPPADDARDTTTVPAGMWPGVDAWHDPREKSVAPTTPSALPRSPARPAPPARGPQRLSVSSDRTEGPSPGVPPPVRGLPVAISQAAPPGPGAQPVQVRFSPSVQEALPGAALPSARPKPPPLNRSARPPAQVPVRDGGVLPPPERSLPPPIRSLNAPPFPLRGTASAWAEVRPPAAAPPKHSPSPLRPRIAEAQAEVKAASPGERVSQTTGITATKLEQLHHQLVEAKRRNNEEVSVGLDELRARLERTERQLRLQHGNRAIEFAVVVKNGRAMIKPKVR